MGKQITIKEISRLSGVSAGTVDRILHNRGRVSDTARAKVEAVLAGEDYKYNIHTSAVSLKKSFTIATVYPTANQGDYWDMVQRGIDKALHEYSDIDITVRNFQYDQYRVESCRAEYDKVVHLSCDAVMIGGTFERETVRLCSQLDSKGVPYIFMDTSFDNCHEIGSYTGDQYRSGRVMGRMLSSMAPGGDICLLRSVRTESAHALNTDRRVKGLTDLVGEISPEIKVFQLTIDPQKQESWDELSVFLQNNHGVRAMAVLNSRGYIIARRLHELGLAGFILGGFDATDKNIECLKEGLISFILDQSPEVQGFESLERIISFLLYRTPFRKEDASAIPVKIVIKEML